MLVGQDIRDKFWIIDDMLQFSYDLNGEGGEGILINLILRMEGRSCFDLGAWVGIFGFKERNEEIMGKGNKLLYFNYYYDEFWINQYPLQKL